jgi:hypothetical protein
MSETRSVDQLLSKVESEKMDGAPPAPVEKPVTPPKEDDKPIVDAESDGDDSADDYGDDNSEPAPQKAAEDDKAPDDEKDEYGNPIAKPKMYSEEEVNRMMRERFSRSKMSQDQQQQVQQAQKDGFKFDENSDESWEIQLEKFVERTVNNISKKQQEAEWQQKENIKQQEFEDKFTTGMNKYHDFKDVVGRNPITNAMLMATRNIDNPAAFIYAASKQHPQELERISKLDQYDQMVEIGRLEERMRKAKIATKAAKPITPPKGDMPNAKDNTRLSIDDKLRQAERKEMKRRERR